MASGTINKVLTIDDVYPIGAVYISVNNTSPATLFGGTWTKISGRFLLATGKCAANSDGYFGSIKAPNTWNPGLGSTGGEDYHTLSVSEIPSHNHTYLDAPHAYVERDNSVGSIICTHANEATNAMTYNTGNKGGGAQHNNMPPYMAVNMWYRTA